MTNEQAIQQAINYIGETEPEIIPVSYALRDIGHPYWDCFEFVFCVACEMGRTPLRSFQLNTRCSAI